MKNFTFLAILLCSFCYAQQPGDLVSAEIKLDLSPSGLVTYMVDNCGAEFNEDIYNYLNGIPVGLQAYKITYKSLDYNDNLVNATGLVMYPKTNKKLSTVLIMAPTTDKRENVPSNLKGTLEIGIVINFLVAVSDYVVVSPDYLGMGDGDGKLAYVEDKTAAAAGLDMLKATDQFFEQMGKPRYDEYFVGGYSQGGHGAMSVNKYNQISKDPYNIKLVASGAGPYDMSKSLFEDGILAVEEYPSSAFISYKLESCHRLGFTQFKKDWNEVISDEYYDQFVASALNGEGGLDWGPEVWRDLFQDDYVAAITNDLNHPARKCVEADDVYDFYNKTPTIMFSSWFDTHILPINDEVTLDAQRAYYPWYDMGKYKIRKSTLGPWNHFIGSLPYILAAIYKFNTQRSGGFFNTRAEHTGEYSMFKENEVQLEYIQSAVSPQISGQATKMIQKKIHEKSYNKVDNLAGLEEHISMIQVELPDGTQRVFPFAKEEAIALETNDVVKVQGSSLLMDFNKWSSDIKSIHFIKDNQIVMRDTNDAAQKSFEYNTHDLPDFDMIEIVANAAIFTVKAPRLDINASQKLKVVQNAALSKVLAHKAIQNVEVYNLNGQLVQVLPANNQKSVDLNLATGGYVIKVNYADNSNENVKFIQK